MNVGAISANANSRQLLRQKPMPKSPRSVVGSHAGDDYSTRAASRPTPGGSLVPALGEARGVRTIASTFRFSPGASWGGRRRRRRRAWEAGTTQHQWTERNGDRVQDGGLT